MDTCPTHANDIRTPDPSGENVDRIGVRKRVQAIQEAEDAGLQGPELQVFVREHEEIYYAELVLKRVG
jgi:hypothetical protein